MVDGVSFIDTRETGVKHLIPRDPQYLSGIPSFDAITINSLKSVDSSDGQSTLAVTVTDFTGGGSVPSCSSVPARPGL